MNFNKVITKNMIAHNASLILVFLCAAIHSVTNIYAAEVNSNKSTTLIGYTKNTTNSTVRDGVRDLRNNMYFLDAKIESLKNTKKLLAHRRVSPLIGIALSQTINSVHEKQRARVRYSNVSTENNNVANAIKVYNDNVSESLIYAQKGYIGRFTVYQALVVINEIFDELSICNTYSRSQLCDYDEASTFGTLAQIEIELDEFEVLIRNSADPPETTELLISLIQGARDLHDSAYARVNFGDR